MDIRGYLHDSLHSTQWGANLIGWCGTREFLIIALVQQHFHISGWNDEENFARVQAHDEYKNQWCKDNNIPLIRIPYTKLDTLCIEDLMLETTQFRVV